MGKKHFNSKLIFPPYLVPYKDANSQQDFDIDYIRREYQREVRKDRSDDLMKQILEAQKEREEAEAKESLELQRREQAAIDWQIEAEKADVLAEAEEWRKEIRLKDQEELGATLKRMWEDDKVLNTTGVRNENLPHQSPSFPDMDTIEETAFFAVEDRWFDDW